MAKLKRCTHYVDPAEQSRVTELTEPLRVEFGDRRVRVDDGSARCSKDLVRIVKGTSEAQWEMEESAEFDERFESSERTTNSSDRRSGVPRTDWSGRANALVVSDKAGQSRAMKGVAAGSSGRSEARTLYAFDFRRKACSSRR